MLAIRFATWEDYERIMDIYHCAQDFMIRSGNPNQWGHWHPKEELIRSDIEAGISRVLYDEEGVHGVFALIEGRDPTYTHIEGAWLNDDPYVTIHRIAGDGQRHGILRCAVEYAKAYAPNIRVDTHADNLPMQRAIAGCGFRYCGVIHLPNFAPRIAYQWAAGAREEDKA